MKQAQIDEQKGGCELAAHSHNHRKFEATQVDRTFHDLLSDYDHGRLVVQPDFQRYSIWNPSKRSRLLESILMKMILPTLYFAETGDRKQELIDGQQRVVSVLAFLKGGELSQLKGKLWDGRLRGLEIFSELNKKKFSDLGNILQERILQHSVRCVVISAESDVQVKFEVFERLNIETSSLNAMEIRNCTCRGTLNDMAKELADHKIYNSMIGNKANDPRMQHVELIIRFFMMYELGVKKYTGKMQRDLTRFMHDFRNPSKGQLETWRTTWLSALKLSRLILGEKAFRRYVPGNSSDPNGYWEPSKINYSLFDTVMQNWYHFDGNQLVPRSEAIREAWIQLQTSEEFSVTLQRGSDRPLNVEIRFRLWRDKLTEICGTGPATTRCFSHDIKRQLFDSKNVCELCAQKIILVDDAEVDHCRPWSKAGKTELHNAQLAHRFCNRQKSAKVA